MMKNQRLFAIAAALALGLTATAAHAIDNAGCRTEWEESTASNTCQSGTVRSVIIGSNGWAIWSQNGNGCNVSTRCLRPSGSGPNHYYVNAGATVSEDDTDDLENCLGTLKVGSC